jgi:hypothetical protein
LKTVSERTATVIQLASPEKSSWSLQPIRFVYQLTIVCGIFLGVFVICLARLLKASGALLVKGKRSPAD